MLLFLPGRGFVFIQQQDCSMEVNISLEDLFGDSIREMRERDKAFLPEPEWFSRIETDLDTFMQTYMTKYPFTSFEAIPRDESGLTFPAFEDLQFYLPQPLRHQPTTIVEVDGLAFLSVLGDGAFCIDPRRWHRIKTYIAKGTVEYPQVSVRNSGVSDGRHRTLLLMQLYNRRTIPVVVPESHYGTFMTEAKNMGAI
ncbi:hypothetical protein IFU37_023345 (plasmid) [Pantoea agglomerans]|uniref:hypothetical protein n=1 Tax=Enterobacter agglomerans TaxID=549 RepID=UPI001FCE337E|nr:hypothetical protein [Pantoea agglomerans]WVL92378.1 hypothetical protein IFU37_023345 [Pantoea agglomerans]